MAWPTCSSCGARISWGKTTEGGRMPLDAQPSREGNVYRLKSGKLRVLSDEERARAIGAGAVLWMSHFASCKAAGAHRGVSREQTALEL